MVEIGERESSGGGRNGPRVLAEFDDVSARIRRRPTTTPVTGTGRWTAERLKTVLDAIGAELRRCRNVNDVDGFLDRVRMLVVRALRVRAAKGASVV